MAPMTMDEFKCEEINFVVLYSWLQENGFARLKRISEGKKNFVIPKLRIYCFWSENLGIKMHIKTAVSFLPMRGLNRKKTAR
jgi:hypothetical protein